MEINESSCLHVRGFDFHTLILNSYMNNKNKKGSCHIAMITAFKKLKIRFYLSDDFT